MSLDPNLSSKMKAEAMSPALSLSGTVDPENGSVGIGASKSVGPGKISATIDSQGVVEAKLMTGTTPDMKVGVYVAVEPLTIFERVIGYLAALDSFVNDVAISGGNPAYVEHYGYSAGAVDGSASGPIDRFGHPQKDVDLGGSVAQIL